MISIDGYYPMSAFLRAARSIITRRLWDHFLAINAEPVIGDEGEDVDWTAPVKISRTEHWHENIEIAARFLIHDIIRRSGDGLNRACILRPDGARMAVQQKVTEPLARLRERDGDYANHRSWRIQDRVVRRDEVVFGVDTFKDDFWLEYFTRDRVFSEVTPAYNLLVRSERLDVAVMNWRQCAIDISMLRAVAAAREHFIAAKEILQRAGCEAPKTLDNISAEMSDISALLRMFEPYDGCPVILHEAHWKALDEISVGLAPAERDAPSPAHPSDAIISILDSEGCIGKVAIRERVLAQFPGTSVRKFDHYWNLVAAKRPEIQKAGPKSKRRFETEINS